MANQNEILKLAKTVSKMAGDFLKKKFFAKKEATRKHNTDEWSTPADLESEELIRRFLDKQDSKSGVLGEEYGWSRPEAKGWWCIDPLDGTSNFIRGISYFSVSIAYLEKGEPIVGVVYDPLRELYYYAQKGKKAYVEFKKNRKTLLASNDSPLILHSLNMSKTGSVPAWALKRVRTAKLRNFGSMALQLSYVASGELDYCISDRAHIWDIAAGGLILNQAKGRIYTFRQKKLFPLRKSDFLDQHNQVVPFVGVSYPRLT